MKIKDVILLNTTKTTIQKDEFKINLEPKSMQFINE